MVHSTAAVQNELRQVKWFLCALYNLAWCGQHTCVGWVTQGLTQANSRCRAAAKATTAGSKDKCTEVYALIYAHDACID